MNDADIVEIFVKRVPVRLKQASLRRCILISSPYVSDKTICYVRKSVKIKLFCGSFCVTVKK